MSSESSTSDKTPENPSDAYQYIVVARRYRPQTFEELIGQEHIGRALCGAITTNRVGHAYLFTGARGVGKTSAARIFAKALNCQDGPAPTPCNACELCQSISLGDDMDVLEIDGASNRGIDEIRQLRQNVNIRPSRARFKIYIIDEVHMLTREAFNALLKTLEEPPEHVKFIFCTTEPTKIPITILSRCQRFDFAGIQTSAIVQRLHQIVESEGARAEPEALAEIARRATGSMRDSQSLLEQLLAISGKKITPADVHTMLGTAGGDRIVDLVDHLVNGDAGRALEELDAAIAEGVDVGQLMVQLLDYFRDCMVASAGSPPESFLHTAEKEKQGIANASSQWPLETILAILQILDQTLSRLRYSTHGRTLAEMALVRICQMDKLDRISEWISQLQSGMGTSVKRVESSPPSGRSHRRPKKKSEADNSAQDRLFEQKAPVPRYKIVDLNAETAPIVWQQILANLSDMIAEHASLSESAAISAPNRLVVSFKAKYNFNKSYCERPESVAKFEKALAEVTGQPTKIEFTLLEDEPEEQPIASGSERSDSLQKQVADHPMVRRAAELFDTHIVGQPKPAD